MIFELKSSYQPTGDQPEAIANLVKGIKGNLPHQVLLGVTGSGKTFTVANVIERTQKPTLVISHNKTLAGLKLLQLVRDEAHRFGNSYLQSKQRIKKRKNGS